MMRRSRKKQAYIQIGQVQNGKTGISKYNRKRALISIICCTLVAGMVFVSMIIRVCTTVNVGIVIGGTAVFRMFTVDSNVLMAVCALLCIPYQIDGYRNRNYHMPRWIIYLMFMGVVAVSLTLLLAVFVLGPITGFKIILFTSTNIVYHLTAPIIDILLFIFVITDHNIKFKYALLAVTPVAIYGIVYIIMAFVIGEDKGGWADVYNFNTYMPWPVMAVIMLTVVLLIATVLRIAHNRMHSRQKARMTELYVIEYGKCADIEEAVRMMAGDDRKNDPGNNDIVIPRRAIKMLESGYSSGRSMEDLGRIYLEQYLEENRR